MKINSMKIMQSFTINRNGLVAVCLLLAPIILASSLAQSQDIKGNQQYSTVRQPQQKQQQRPTSLSNNQFKRPAANNQQQAVTGAPASSLYGYPSESALGIGPGTGGRQVGTGYGSAPVQVAKQQKQQPLADTSSGYDSPDYNSPGSSDSGYGANSGNNQDQQDSEADSEPALYGSVAGKPGVDFPAYTRIPKTSFTCEGKGYDFGYYADEETGCQAYHVCWSGRHESFLCGVGTVFNQAILACDYWHSVDCSKSSQFYSVNAELGKSSSEPANSQLQQPSRSQQSNSNGPRNNNNNNNNYNVAPQSTPIRSPVASSPAAIGTQQQQRYNNNNNNNINTSQDYPRSPVSASAGGNSISAGYGNNNNNNNGIAQTNNNQALQQTYGRNPAKTNANRSPSQQQRQQPQQQYGARPQSVSAPTPLPFGQSQRNSGLYPQQQQQPQFIQQQRQQPQLARERATTIGYSQQTDKDDASNDQDQQQLNNNFDDTPVQTTTIQSPILGNSLSANNYNANPATTDLRRNNANTNYANNNNNNPATSSAITTQYDTIINHNNQNNQQLGQTFEQLEDQQQRQSEDGLKGARAAASNNRNWYIMRPIENH